MRSEQRNRTAQRHSIPRVAPLFHLSDVARPLSRDCGTGMRTARALERRKIGSNAARFGISTGSYAATKAQLRKAGRQPNSQGSVACSLAVAVVAGVLTPLSANVITNLPRSATRGYSISVSISPAYFHSCAVETSVTQQSARNRR